MELLANADIDLVKFELLNFVRFDIDFTRQQFRVLGSARERHFDIAAAQYHGCQFSVNLFQGMTGKVHADVVFPCFSPPLILSYPA